MKMKLIYFLIFPAFLFSACEDVSIIYIPARIMRGNVTLDGTIAPYTIWTSIQPPISGKLFTDADTFGDFAVQ
ncbi:MAG: hypothetical protein ACLTXP_12990 [Odoribacter splanchnicus]